MESGGRVVAITEVEAHNTTSDAWMAIDGIVYDVTDFAEGHPGGAEILLDHAGTDASDAFNGDHEHAQDPSEILDASKRIGVLEGSNGVWRKDLGQNAVCMQRAKEVIDPTKPYTFQVGKLLEHYQDWVHTPIHTDKSIVLLGGWMEMFTMTPWWIPLVFWIPVVIGMLRYSVMNWTMSKLIPTYLISVACWPFLEFFLHRVVYHMGSSSYWGNTMHFLFHGVHHLTPMDKTRLVAPPLLTIIISTPVTSLIYAFSPSPGFAWTMTAGLFSGYLVYDEIHYWLHHGDLPWEWLRVLKSHHMEHHYSVPDSNFGVSMTLTDHIFGTFWSRESEAQKAK